MSGRSFRLAVGLLLLAGGCAGTPAAGSTATAADPVTVDADALPGYWTRYWSPSGEAAGARYLLMPDGRFGWRAAPDAEGETLRRGRWRLRDGSLHLEIEDPATTAPPRARTIPLGRCPDNAEARALDPDYQCLSLDGEAFFRHPVGDAPVADFL